jgi:hypothetical protein
MWEVYTKLPAYKDSVEINPEINLNIQTDLRPCGDAFQAHSHANYI